RARRRTGVSGCLGLRSGNHHGFAERQRFAVLLTVVLLFEHAAWERARGEQRYGGKAVSVSGRHRQRERALRHGSPRFKSWANATLAEIRGIYELAFSLLAVGR